MDSTDNDNALAEKLRCVDPEQYHTLVRMHLSFVLDLQTDDVDCNVEKNKFRPLKWSFAPFTRKPKTQSKGVMEGAPLTQEGICQVYQLIEYLRREENICQEGIFRRSGSIMRQQELKNLLNQGIPLNLDDAKFSVHDCASVLKNFLAELPEPLLTDSYYPAYCQIAEHCVHNVSSDHSIRSEARLLRALQLLLLLLPAENRVLAKDILQLLHLTANNEERNKMSPESLATLFTPHLLCPRKMSPEALHTNSQTMSRVIAFMIDHCTKLFFIPPTLATDVRAYWAEHDKRRLSPKKQDVSICDGTAANTVFSFVDRERTAEASTSNTTEAALAQLYTHIQSLPESSKKRRLLKQFNKENGCGTPSEYNQKRHMRSKSLGNSIKKHLFSKSLKRQKSGSNCGNFNVQRSSSEEILNQHSTRMSMCIKMLTFNRNTEGSLFSYWCRHVHFFSPDCRNTSPKLKLYQRSSHELSSSSEASPSTCYPRMPDLKKSLLSPAVSLCLQGQAKSAKSPIESSESIGRESEERTPRVSKLEANEDLQRPILRNLACQIARNHERMIKHPAFDGSRQTFRKRYQGASTPVPVPLVTPSSASFYANENDSESPPKLSRFEESNHAAGSNADLPCVGGATPQSATTEGTDLLETMMTPRSRKPVLVISGSNIAHLASIQSESSLNIPEDSLSTTVLRDHQDQHEVYMNHFCNSTRNEEEETAGIGDNEISDGLVSDKLQIEVKETTKSSDSMYSSSSIWDDSIKDSLFGSDMQSSDSLTSTFKDYLLSRSVLTASPIDLSLTDSTQRASSLDSNPSRSVSCNSLAQNSAANCELSESLLYCLDGNVPSQVKKSEVSSSSLSTLSSKGCVVYQNNINIHSTVRKRNAENTLKAPRKLSEEFKNEEKKCLREYSKSESNIKGIVFETSL